MYMCTTNVLSFFFFNETPTTEIYTHCHTLSLHDALPICPGRSPRTPPPGLARRHRPGRRGRPRRAHVVSAPNLDRETWRHLGSSCVRCGAYDQIGRAHV